MQKSGIAGTDIVEIRKILYGARNVRKRLETLKKRIAKMSVKHAKQMDEGIKKGFKDMHLRRLLCLSLGVNGALRELDEIER